MSFMDHLSPAPILDPQAPVMDAGPRSTFWIETQPEPSTPMTQPKPALV